MSESATSNHDATILLVEDEAKTRASIAEALSLQGWNISAAVNGDEASRLLAARAFDLAIVDWMIPGPSGIELVASMRHRGIPTPVLMLTARDSVRDRVSGLEAGADDYLPKPFALAELLARCRALLRRGGAISPLFLSIADLRLDVRARTAERNGQAIALTPREVDVLEYLLRQAGQVVTREMLQRDVWRQSARFTSLDNVIDVQIARLRRKVDDGFPVKLIHTLRGLGYRIGTTPP